jgi:hypothetical protein
MPNRHTRKNLSANEIKRRRNTLRSSWASKIRNVKVKRNNNENYGNVYPVPNFKNIPVGNVYNTPENSARALANFNVTSKVKRNTLWKGVLAPNQAKSRALWNLVLAKKNGL